MSIYLAFAVALLLLIGCNVWLIWRWHRLKQWIVGCTLHYEQQQSDYSTRWMDGVVFGRVRMCDDVLARMYQLEQGGVTIGRTRRQAHAARKTLARHSLLRKIGL